MDNKCVPQENIELYCAIYKIEVFLRELIVELLEDIGGPKWYKEKLPEDILDKYNKSVEYERKNNWFQVTPLHPIYYIDFADLVKIIEKKDNWKYAFANIFKRKEHISVNLKGIEFIRNKVSHNRKANKEDCRIVNVLLTYLISRVGQFEFERYILKCTSEPDILSYLLKLEDELKSIYEEVKKVLPVKNTVCWHTVKSAWWFDETYLGVSLESIKNYFEMIEEYMIIPRHRGSGYKIQKWISIKNIESIYHEAEDTFNIIKKSGWFK